MAYLYIVGCIGFTVYGQLIIKWRMSGIHTLPEGLLAKGLFLSRTLFCDPFILSGFGAAFLAALCWMAAMTRFELSFAYPFMALAFVLVLLFSVMFLGEAFTLGKVVGLALILSGILVMIHF